MFVIKRLIPISVTATGSYGSERHNTDPEFRAKLPHVDDSKVDIIHLHPYVPYKDRINEIAHSYIETYNRRRDEAYAAALMRYEEGEIKCKPSKSKYKHRSYDYYNHHRLQYVRSSGKTEIVPPFRSLIIHLGNREDRINGTISFDCAIAIFRALFEEFKKHFPLFLILCAVVHTGEYGNEIHDQLGGWHMHIDYLPVYDLGPDGPGLRMGTGLDEALRRMGYEAEDSIVITRHRPLLYTTMHNMMFRIMERILPDYGFRLKLGVTAETYPDKDPGRNLPLPAWQAHMQETVDVQAVKNKWLDVLMADEVSPDSVKQALGSLAIVQDAMRTVQGASKTWDGSAYKLPETDYIRLQGAVESMMDTMAYVIAKGEQADTYSARVDDLSKQLDALQIENARLEREISALRQKELDRRIKMAEAERQCRDLQRIINRQIAFMKSIQNGAHTIYNLYNEMYDDRNKSRE